MNEFVTAAADSVQRRSQLYHLQQAAGAEFAQLQNVVVVKQFADDEAAQLASLAMIDLSTLPRTGFKGRQTPQWLTEQGVNIPDKPNQAAKQADGSLVARLSEQEHLILCDISMQGVSSATLADALDSHWQIQEDLACYSLPRRDSHAWLYLSGEHVRSMLAKVCGIDLSAAEFANGQIAQTSIARINGILIRDDLKAGNNEQAITGFHLLCDSSSVIFVWQSLLDAMAEFDGKPVGVAALLDR